MADLGAIGFVYPQVETLVLVPQFTFPIYAVQGKIGTLTLSGSVDDDAGSPAARTVMAFRRKTGEFVGSTVSNAATGAWSIKTPYSDEHDIICQDDDAGTAYNDLIARATPA